MGRPKDKIWEEVTKLENGRWLCNRCENDYAGGVNKIKAHLGRIKGKGIITLCTKGSTNSVPKNSSAMALLDSSDPMEIQDDENVHYDSQHSQHVDVDAGPSSHPVDEDCDGEDDDDRDSELFEENIETGDPVEVTEDAGISQPYNPPQFMLNYNSDGLPVPEFPQFEKQSNYHYEEECAVIVVRGESSTFLHQESVMETRFKGHLARFSFALQAGIMK